MRLAKQAWPSTFHYLLVLMSISSLLGLLTIVDAHTGLQPPQMKREYTEAFQGVDHGESLFSMSNSAVVKRPLHPVYEAREFLVEHNIVRKQFGEPPLVWDRTLAHYARRFAGQRAANCDMVHTSESPYGENIYWGANYFKHTAAAAVRAWAGEIHDYNPLTNTCSPSKLCGHYKQIVWRTSSKVGCARVKCNNGGVYIICAYDPPGNYENESPFDIPINIPIIFQGPSQSSQTPPTPVAQTKTPASVQTLKYHAAQTKTPTSVGTPPTPAAQSKTPASVQTLKSHAAQTKTPTSVGTPPTTAAQTKTPTPTAQTPPTPAAQSKTPASVQTLKSHAAQTKTPTSVGTPPTPAAQTKTPTSVQTLKTPAALTTPTSPSTPS